jgi:hypothetical protein
MQSGCVMAAPDTVPGNSGLPWMGDDVRFESSLGRIANCSIRDGMVVLR